MYPQMHSFVSIYSEQDTDDIQNNDEDDDSGSIEPMAGLGAYLAARNSAIEEEDDDDDDWDD